VYKQHIVDIAVNVGHCVEEHHPQRFIHLSTAQVYDAEKKQSTEQSKLKPWTKQAVYHLQAEGELKKMRIPLIILRPALVYGPADVQGLSLINIY
jgi:nucleoside-diphosphate-sugar epimerase